MNRSVRSIAEQCTRGSEDDSLDFPQQLAKLSAVGIEGYYADLRAGRKTYYLPNGENLDIDSVSPVVPVAEHFDAARVETAVRQSQAGTHSYKEFCSKVMAAGCPAYIVSILGRRVVYFGRTAEFHVEHFPT
jgi:uncharacterized protein YbcV (DUF1398 family)